MTYQPLEFPRYYKDQKCEDQMQFVACSAKYIIIYAEESYFPDDW